MLTTHLWQTDRRLTRGAEGLGHQGVSVGWV